MIMQALLKKYKIARTFFARLSYLCSGFYLSDINFNLLLSVSLFGLVLWIQTRHSIFCEDNMQRSYCTDGSLTSC